MSKGHGLIKMQAIIMKLDAQADYDTVKMVCKQLGLTVVKPKGESAWKIEDATAQMIKTIPVEQKLQLRKGLSYYASITPLK
jgi:hypothetical protein